MQITSSNPSSLSTIQLSLQSTQSRSRVETPVSAVERRETRDAEQQIGQQQDTPSINTDPATERKLANIGRVQFAFSAALKIGQAIENAFLLEPIV